MRILTLQRILNTNPCLEQREILLREFPEGISLTPGGLERVLAAGLDVTWGWYFLTPKQMLEYHNVAKQAWDELELVRAQAEAKYYGTTGQAWNEYHNVQIQAWIEYDRVTIPAFTKQAWTEYCRVVERALEEYDKATAPAKTECNRVKDQALAKYRRMIGTWLMQNINV